MERRRGVKTMLPPRIKLPVGGDFHMDFAVNSTPQTMLIVGRRILLAAVAGALLGLPAHAAQYLRGQLIPEIKLKNGTVLHDVTVTAVGSTTVMARWDGGRGSIPLQQLPAEISTDLVAAAGAAKPAFPAPAGQPGGPPALFDPAWASAELPTEIKLTNGFVMHKATVTRWDKTAALIAYQGGIVSVRFQNIAPEQRPIFEARKDEALARQAKDDAAKAAGQVASTNDERAHQEADRATRQAAEKKEEEIRNGISFHYLVKGMTKEQVRQAYGRAGEDHGDSLFYASRGHDKYGNSADRFLIFKDGLLDGWHDERQGEPAGAVDH